MIPLDVRARLKEDPQVCARLSEGDCAGEITWEHALLYAGKQIQEVFAIIKLCQYHHGVGNYANCYGQNKKIHREIAMSRATEEDKKKYPRLWK